jgi:hypothetical protein
LQKGGLLIPDNFKVCNCTKALVLWIEYYHKKNEKRGSKKGRPGLLLAEPVASEPRPCLHSERNCSRLRGRLMF